MQWCVYLMMIPAAFFLGQVALELIGRPIQTILRIRHRAIERMLAFRNMQLPGPRELAVSSRQIREHEQAARNVRLAQRSLADLGARMLAFSESEPTIRALMAMCGLDTVLAGRELIKLADVYAAAKTDSGKLRHAIEKAHQATMTALAVSRPRSGDGLIKIRLEPMHLRDVSSSLARRSPPGRRTQLLAAQAQGRAKRQQLIFLSAQGELSRAIAIQRRPRR